MPTGSRVGDLWTALAGEISLFGRFPAAPPVAVNEKYVDSGTVLAEGDEVAFLPPVAGG